MKNKYRNSQAFTLVESLVVLAVIGLITAVAALGFGEATRQKMLENASRKIQGQLSKARDLSIFGEEVTIDNITMYPCGYGVILKKGSEDGDSGAIIPVYTNNNDRIFTVDQNTTCDEEFLARNPEKPSSNQVSLKINSNIDNELLDLNKEQSAIKEIKIKTPEEVNVGGGQCAAFLFSSPRGGAYYAILDNCDSFMANQNDTFILKSFTNDPQGNNPPSLAVVKMESKDNQSSSKTVKIYPSGNVEIVTE